MKSKNRLETAIPLLLICAAQLAMALIYTNHMHLPLIHADEGGYLINALAIAGETNGGSGLDYYAGFSLLLAPFALDGAASVYRAALIMNSVFVAVMPLAYWVVLRRVFPALSRGRALLVVALASFFPSHFVLAHLAFSDNLLIFAFGYAFVLFIMANERTGRSRWLLAAVAGVLLGWCFLANPRGIVNGMAFVAVACAFSFKHRSLRSTSLVMAAAWAGCILAHPLVEGLALKQATSDASGYSVSALLGKLLTPESLWKSLRNFIGVSTYVSIATLGLVFALLSPVKQAIGNLLSRDRSRGDAMTDMLLTAVLASVVGSILLTALFFQEFLRVDHLFYGRYVASSLAPCALLAAGALLDGRARPASIALGIVFSLVAIVFLRQAYQGITLPTGLAPFNVVEIYPFISTDGVFRWSQLVYALLAGAGLFLLLYVFRPALGLVFGLCLYVCMGFITSERFLWRQAAHDAPITNFVTRVNKVIASSRKPVCLRIDPRTDTWHVIHYRLYFSRYVGLDAKAGGGECVQAVLVPSSAAADYFRLGYQALAQDVREPNFLMMPWQDLPLGKGPAGEGMDARILSPLPAEERRASLHVDAMSPNPVAAGETARLWVTVKNESSQPWPRFNQSNPLPGAVRLGARLTSIDNPDRKISELRAELPGALLEGEEVQVMLELPGTLSPGRYVMNVNLVNDGVAWFDCTSQSGCYYEIVVGPASFGSCVLGRGGCAFLMDLPGDVTR